MTSQEIRRAIEEINDLAETETGNSNLRDRLDEITSICRRVLNDLSKEDQEVA